MTITVDTQTRIWSGTKWFPTGNREGEWVDKIVWKSVGLGYLTVVVIVWNVLFFLL